jgi:16S rRNA (guanine527-N7)-methyltransferase
MTEDEARAWIAELDVPRGTTDRLERLVTLVQSEQVTQNLVARSTLAHLWSRHVVDSLQLLALAPDGPWLDIGSGAGFPGLVVAAASMRTVTLAEPRTKRARFLVETALALGMGDRVAVHAGRVEMLPATSPFAVVSARAVAGLSDLFAMAGRHVDRETTWLLPKGRSAAEELAAARRTWQGEMRLVPSLTDPQASIVVARDLSRRT